MSEQNTIAEEQQKAYEALAHDFTDFIKAKVRAGENSYKLVNRTFTNWHLQLSHSAGSWPLKEKTKSFQNSCASAPGHRKTSWLYSKKMQTSERPSMEPSIRRCYKFRKAAACK